MASIDDDVDFKKLANEVSHALAKEEKYQRENDAKFRAINQKVRSYEEFRDIVDASHLKPLDKNDKIGGMSYQKWNHIAESNFQVMPNQQQCEDGKLKSFSQPQNAFEFSRVFKRDCCTAKAKFDYLVSIERDALKKCLEGDCMLGDVITALHSFEELYEGYAEKIVEILDVISKSKRFSLALDFLSKNEVLKLKTIFKNLESFQENDQTLLTQLFEIYNV